MKLLRLISLSLLLSPLLRQPAMSQTPDPTFTPPTSLYAPGQVRNLGPAQADGKRLVAGYFSRVNGVAVSNLVRLDAAGTLDQAFSQRVGMASNVSTIKGLANGQYLVKGIDSYGSNVSTVTAGGLTRTGLLRLNADGSADAAFDAGTGAARSTRSPSLLDFAALPDGKILVGGEFDTFNGQPANGLVRLTANGSLDASFSAGAGPVVTGSPASGSVATLAVLPDGKILVGGEFDTFNGQPANGLLRLNANGSVDPTFVFALGARSIPTKVVLQSDGKVLVAGGLHVGSAASGLVRLTASGSLDSGFAPTALAGSFFGNYTDPNVLVQPDGKILLFGSLSLAGSPAYLVRLNPNGSQDTSFQLGAGPSGPPNTMGLQADGAILVGGSFNTFNGTEKTLGRLTATGAADPAFAPKLQTKGAITTVLRQADGQLLLGGNFTELSGQPVHRVARLTVDGELDAAYAAAVGVLPSLVTTMTLQADGKLLVGTYEGLRRLLPSGSPEPGFNPFAAQAYIGAIAVQAEGRILVGGNFYITTGGVLYRNLVRLTAGGAIDPSFAGAATGAAALLINMRTLLIQPDGRIVAGGLRFGGQPGVRSHLVRYEATGAVDASFNAADVAFTYTASGAPAADGIYALALQPDGKLLVGGRFDAVGGVARPSLARLTTTGTLDAGFVPPATLDGPVYALAQQPNGRVVLGGSFSLGPLRNLARLLSNGLPDSSFRAPANPNDYVTSLLVQPDGALMLSGAFTDVGGQPAYGVARLLAPNTGLAVAAPGVAARTAVWPVPAHSVLHVRPDAGAQPRRLELLDGLGRVVRTQPVTTPAADQVLNVEALPAGIYLLRVQYAAGAVTRRVAMQ